jgi:CDP-glucose 4,6-dehydratase
LEPLHGYLFLVERLWEKGPDFCGGWNFGPSAEGVRTVSWVADKMTELWKGKACWQSGCESMPLHEANLLMLDCSKARTLLQWKPKLSLHDALTRIVGWYQSYHSGKDMQRVSFGEIAYYEQYGGPVMNIESESQQ